MNPASSTLPETPSNAAPAMRRSEVKFLGGVYAGTGVLGSLTVSACGPGCCFIFFMILAIVSGLLMFRRPFGSWVFCFIMLLFSLVGMWHEKEVRDTWEQNVLRRQIRRLQEELQKSKAP